MNTSNPTQELIKKSTEHIGISSESLEIWNQPYTLYPMPLQIQFWHLTNKYQLDPMNDEITWLDMDIKGPTVWITMNGWMKILNQQTSFSGIQFREDKEHEIPQWLECTIYRNDRVLPIVVTEHLDEVKTNHISWQLHARRMLRHRTLQQAIRLAFGISLLDAKIEPEQDLVTISFNVNDSKEEKPKISKTELLKNELLKNL